MKHLFEQIENHTLPLSTGLLVVAVSLIVVVLFCHFLPEIKKAKR